MCERHGSDPLNLISNESHIGIRFTPSFPSPSSGFSFASIRFHALPPEFDYLLRVDIRASEHPSFRPSLDTTFLAFLPFSFKYPAYWRDQLRSFSKLRRGIGYDSIKLRDVVYKIG
jgi:hypothetical protein